MVLELGRSQFQLVDCYREHRLFVDCGWVEESESDEGPVDQGGKNFSGYQGYCFGDWFEWLGGSVGLMVELRW